MIEQTISRIEERLRAAETLDPEQRAELETLLAQLRAEARSLPADLLRESDHSGEDVHGTVGRLQEALTAFETSHPQLTGVVNRISTILANMGI